MNKYLEKIAEARKEDSTGRKWVKGYVSLGVGGLAATPAALLSQKSGRRLINDITPSQNSVADRGTIKKFMRDNKLHSKVTFNHRSHALTGQGLNRTQRAAVDLSNLTQAPAYLHNQKGKGFVIGVKQFKARGSHGAVNKDVIMHELGHAKDFSRHGAIKQIGMMVGRHPVSKAGFGVATLGALASDEHRDKAPAIAAVPGALVLREEMAANYHAYKGIRAHKGAAGANRFLKNVVSHNTKNYALAGAVPVIAAGVAKKIMDKWSPRKDDRNK